MTTIRRFLTHPAVAYPLSLLIGIYAGMLVEKRTERSDAQEARYTVTQNRVGIWQLIKNDSLMFDELADLK